MKEEVEIPGMYISREDLRIVIYQKHLGFDYKDAVKKSKEMTDDDFNDIAYAFSEQFFDVHEELFSKLLTDAYLHLKGEL